MSDRVLRIYGRKRSHKLSAAAQSRLNTLLPKLSIHQKDEIIPSHLFAENMSSYALEIGFGKGKHLIELASSHPKIGFIGCDIFIDGISKLLSAIEKKGLKNIRIDDGDIRLLIKRFICSSFKDVYILFPDPWPKKRHNKRRIISEDLIDDLARIMCKSGVLRIFSDDVSYIREIIFLFNNRCEEFRFLANSSKDWSLHPQFLPFSDYELKALAQKRKIYFLNFERL